MADSDQHDEPKPLKYKSIPTWQFFLRVVPDSVDDVAPAGERAVPANAPTVLDTRSWPEETTRIAGIRLNCSPTLTARRDSRGWPQEYSGTQILVEAWDGPNSSLALWIGPTGEYPTVGYAPTPLPMSHDRTESVELVHGREFHLASFRLTRRDQPTEYHVAAYWRLDNDLWAKIMGRSDSRTGQEHLFAMIRSMR
jgi:hypothetical protein